MSNASMPFKIECFWSAYKGNKIFFLLKVKDTNAYIQSWLVV